MAELPASWGLKTRRRGKEVDVIGKDDNGQEYKVRTCEGGVTDADVAAIRECDRETYRSREAGARAYTQSVVDMGKEVSTKKDVEDTMEWFEAADRMTHQMGYGRRPTSLPRHIDIRPLSQRGLEKN